MQVEIRPPHTQDEWDQYYKLRWRILRKPWGEPEGSEKDDIENECIHIAAFNNDNVIGIGRLQFNSSTESQIRYMAVEPDHERQNVGRSLVEALEIVAKEHGRIIVMLDAREPAVKFYEKLGFAKKEKTYLLFDSIQHYKMEKALRP